MSITVKGNHPYADEFPMASEEELAELTESINIVGLVHPIVLTPDGLVLDGRNRLEACRRAEVEPTFEIREGNDDDFKEFVIGVNTTGRRESMTVQIAAASVALILGHEKRINGQWRRGALGEDLHLTEVKKALAQAGTVLDVLGPPHLRAVRDGETSLNAAYEEARRELDRQESLKRREQELIDRERAEEEAAQHFFATHNAAGIWLAERVGKYDSIVAARTDYERHDREARLAREAEERAARAEQQRLHEEDQRVAQRLQSFTVGYSTAIDFRAHDRRDQVLDCMDKVIRAEFLTLEDHIKEWSHP